MPNYPRYYHRTWRISPPYMDPPVPSTINRPLPLNYIGNCMHGELLTTVSISLPKPIWQFGIFGPIYLIGSSVRGTRHNPTTDCQLNCIYPSGVFRHSSRYASVHIPEAQRAFKVMMIRKDLQFALCIIFHYVICRDVRLDIHFWKL